MSVMDTDTISLLCQLNNRFYEECASSFSHTREAPWEGWYRCLPLLRQAASPSGDGLRLGLIDLACGNGRFSSFAAEELSDIAISIDAVDNCRALASAKVPSPKLAAYTYHELDLIAHLTQGRSLAEALNASEEKTPSFQMADALVCFGFFHHIPSYTLRRNALRDLFSLIRSGGLLVVSLWCLWDDPRLSAKAARSFKEAHAALGAPELEPGDTFLGWQKTPGLWRYCHGFSEEEADSLIEAVADQGSCLARFRADGKSKRLNLYLIFRKH